MIAQIKTHEYANLLPQMRPDEYADLVSDIAANGVLMPIIMKDGQVLDGRHRAQACSELGIDWRDNASELDPEVNALQFVVSANLTRRHLSIGQRAMIAATMATLRHGGDRQSEEFKGSNDPSIDDAAKLLNVSSPSVKRAKHVIEHASKAVVDAVEADELKASLAEKFIKSCPDKQEQAKIVKEGGKAVRDYVARHTEKKPVKSSAPKKAVTKPDEPRDLLDLFVEIQASIRSMVSTVPAVDRAGFWRELVKQLDSEDIATWTGEVA